MSFIQLKLEVNSDVAELLSDIFFDLGALSVTIEDQHAGTELEQAIFDEPGMEVAKLWQHSLVVVLLNNDADIKLIIAQASMQSGTTLAYTKESVDDQDWVRLTQSQFTPIKVAPKLYIVPSWHTLPDPNAVGIILDPGLAFGTGSHPTTFMCLEWLATNVKGGINLLDYGCGSGILAITAKKLGASQVSGVDIDKQALEASKYNALRNQVAVSFYSPDTYSPQEHDVVVANILSNPLRLLASALASYVKPGGTLILSGILANQSDEMMAIYQQWFSLTVYKSVDGWVCLSGIKHE